LKTTTSIPYAAPTDRRLSSTALRGRTTDRKALISTTNVRTSTASTSQGKYL